MDDMTDGFWTGRVDWGTVDRDTGHNRRPDGMDGRARKVYTDGRDAAWWQVPDDVPEENIAGMASMIRDLLVYGYSVVVVKLHEELTDSIGGAHPVVIRYRAIGGIEPFPSDEYLADVAADLVAEVLG